MTPLRIINRLPSDLKAASLRNFRSSVLLSSGGGGGRPGGKPVLNWKQKKILDMGFEVNDNKTLELKSFGDFEDIEKLIDLSDAKVIDLSAIEEYRSEVDSNTEEGEEEIPGFKAPEGKKKKHVKGPRPQIDMSQLFGSHKVAYHEPDNNDRKAAIKAKKKFFVGRVTEKVVSEQA